MRDRAAALGWPPPNVLLIDDDLGLSGRGSDDRHGFQRILADVAQDRVGLVLALEMSRLARNSRDWHNLFDLCAVRDVLLADEDGVYDPGDINDRLILGMKGIMSEMELHVMKLRLERGRRNKAERGELFHSVPWGYVLLPDGTVVLDPDEQVCATVRRLFDSFHRHGTAYAVVRDLRRHDVKLPSRDGNGQIAWRLATVTIVSTALHHPLYAGRAYRGGRRQTQTHIDVAGLGDPCRRQARTGGMGRSVARPRPGIHHLGPVSGESATVVGKPAAPGNEGHTWRRLGVVDRSGVLRCCGRKMYVSYQSIRHGRYCCSRSVL